MSLQWNSFVSVSRARLPTEAVAVRCAGGISRRAKKTPQKSRCLGGGIVRLLFFVVVFFCFFLHADDSADDLNARVAMVAHELQLATLYLWQPQDFNLCEQRTTLVFSVSP